MRPLLEVIVTSLDDAREAEQGGAGRIEIVRDLARDGFTPSLDLVSRIVCAVRIPVRVMVRESESHAIPDESTAARLCYAARDLAQLPVDGLVLGFLRGPRVDVRATGRVLACAPSHRATFHRAFEHVEDPAAGFLDLVACGQIDRVLLSGGTGDWRLRRRRLGSLAAQAPPAIQLIVGGGLTRDDITRLAGTPGLREFHVGRAARTPATPEGAVRGHLVAALARAAGIGV